MHSTAMLAVGSRPVTTEASTQRYNLACRPPCVMPTFGFFALFGFAIGLILGGLVGVFLDRATKTSRGVAQITETKARATKARKPKN
jgi:hypothetical protein